MDNIRLLYIDLFCGAGGTSTGVEKANYKERKCAKVIACVNHDANAIASHAANHPEAQHYTEDMRTLDLRPLAEHTAEMRRMYPMAKVVLWASLECTNFSRAKGGQPRDADSRTLAEHLFRYIEALTPDYIQIENVEEFMSWGDLDENGKPKETATVQAPDTPPVRKGDMVHLAVGALNGFYIVKSVQHDADSGKMTMQVEKADTTAKKKTETKKKTYKVGDVVNFHGGKHYISSYPGAKGYNVSAGRAKITIANGSGKAHPWHLVYENWSETHVYGWVDDGSFD